MMKGLTVASLKKHPSLIPLFACVGAGVVFAGYYIARLAIRCPDVGWIQKSDGMANERWPVNKQYKFYSPIRDYSKLREADERPKF